MMDVYTGGATLNSMLSNEHSNKWGEGERKVKVERSKERKANGHTCMQ